jgi:metal-responsive CopG/Arc/MetJ family transcriptional regulator
MRVKGKMMTDKLILKVPAQLAEALDQIANKRMQSRSELIRQSLLKVITEEGLAA